MTTALCNADPSAVNPAQQRLPEPTVRNRRLPIDGMRARLVHFLAVSVRDVGFG